MIGTTNVRTALRLLGVAGVVAGVVGIGTVGIGITGAARGAGPAAPGSGFAGYRLSATAPGLQITEDEPSANSHPEAEAEVPQSVAALNAGPFGYGLSSIAWPGALAANGGSLLVLAGAPVPPQVASSANEPVRAEARTGSTPTASYDAIPGVTMIASATNHEVTAAAHLNQVGSAVATIGAVDTLSTTVLDAANGKASATSSFSDVVLGGGVVHIAGLQSDASGSTDGVTPRASGHTVVHGVTVAGVPVAIDSQGIHVGSTELAHDPTAGNAVNNAVKALGLQMLLTEPSMARVGGGVDYDAGSLVVLWKPPGAVNVFTATLGGARLSLAARPGGAALDGLPTVDGARTLPAVGLGIGSGPTAAQTPALGSPPPSHPAGTSATGTPASAPGGGPGTARPAPTPIQGRLLTFATALPIGWTLLVLLGALALALGLLRVPASLGAAEPICPQGETS